MATVLDKGELYAVVDDFFPDNQTGEITAEKLRQFADFMIASNLVQLAYTVETSPYDLDVEVDTLLLEAGADIVNLTEISEHKDRFLIIGNASGNTVRFNAFAGDTIDGKTFINILNGSVGILAPFVAIKDWQAVSNTRDRIRVTVFAEGNILPTTINAVDVYEDININLSVSGTSNNFTVAGNLVTYTGDIDLIGAYIETSASVICTQNDKQVSLKIVKNKGLPGELVLDGRSTANAHTTKQGNVSLFTQTDLTKNDTISYIITNMSNTADVTVTDMSGQIKEVAK